MTASRSLKLIRSTCVRFYLLIAIMFIKKHIYLSHKELARIPPPDKKVVISSVYCVLYLLNKFKGVGNMPWRLMT